MLIDPHVNSKEEITQRANTTDICSYQGTMTFLIAMCIDRLDFLQMMAVSNESSPVVQEVIKEEDARVYPVNVSSNINATLDTRYLWKQFDELGTEMIVTRRGRYV